MQEIFCWLGHRKSELAVYSFCFCSC